MINWKCIFGHEFNPWRSDGNYIASANAQIRFCKINKCRKVERRFDLHVVRRND